MKARTKFLILVEGLIFGSIIPVVTLPKYFNLVAWALMIASGYILYFFKLYRKKEKVKS